MIKVHTLIPILVAVSIFLPVLLYMVYDTIQLLDKREIQMEDNNWGGQQFHHLPYCLGIWKDTYENGTVVYSIIDRGVCNI